MRWLTLLVSATVLACSGAPGPSDGADGGADAGPTSCLDARPACAWPGRWTVRAHLAPDFDAGGFSPCLPLPTLAWTVAVDDARGTSWCSDAQLSWAADAGCALRFEDAFTSSNPSETYRHATALVLELDDGGVRGDGTYTLTGGSNCVVPVMASGAPAP
jgi:hypothetical protein